MVSCVTIVFWVCQHLACTLCTTNVLRPSLYQYVMLETAVILLQSMDFIEVFYIKKILLNTVYHSIQTFPETELHE